MPAVNDVGEPCAGEPHARFDGRALETEQTGQGTAVPGPVADDATTTAWAGTTLPTTCHRASARPYMRMAVGRLVGVGWERRAGRRLMSSLVWSAVAGHSALSRVVGSVSGRVL